MEHSHDNQLSLPKASCQARDMEPSAISMTQQMNMSTPDFTISPQFCRRPGPGGSAEVSTRAFEFFL